MMKQYTVFYSHAYQIDVFAKNEEAAIEKAHTISYDKWMMVAGDSTAEEYPEPAENRLWAFVWGEGYEDQTPRFLMWDDICVDDSITEPLELDAMAVGQCLDLSGPTDTLHVYRVR